MVSSMTTEFDSLCSCRLGVLRGNSFPMVNYNATTMDRDPNLDQVTVYIDGQAQETVFYNATHTKFRIRHIYGSFSSNLQVYFSDGMPAFYETANNITVEPTFYSISVSSASSGGSLIRVRGDGFGIHSTGVTLRHKITGENLCRDPATVKLDIPLGVVSYGVFNCLTRSMEISSNDELELEVDGQSLPCYNPGASDCYLNAETTLSPFVGSYQIFSHNRISFSGYRFYRFRFWWMYMIINGVMSDEGTLVDGVFDDDTLQTLHANFANGVPACEG
jgi:hypothetical protein